MFNYPPLKQHIVETLFDTVYRLAKAKDERGVAEIVAKGYCLDILQGDVTPAALLAKEGDFESVEFLINKFDVRLSQIIYGYALRGYQNKVEELLSPMNIHYAVEGYAYAGNVDQVENLLSRGGDIAFAVGGYARYGNVDQVENLLSRGANKDQAVYGYALRGYKNKVENLLSRGGDIDFAIAGYACCGNVDQVENLLSRGADKNRAVYEYACGGYINQVENLLSRGGDIEFAVYGYARCGHVDQVENLLFRISPFHNVLLDNNNAVNAYAANRSVDKVNDLLSRNAGINNAVRGYIMGLHLDKIENLLSRGVAPRAVIAACVEKNCLRKESFLCLLSLINDPQIRKNLADEAEKQDHMLNDQLLAKAAKINRIMKEYPLSYYQAKSLLVKGGRAWLLQGQEKQLPREVFFYLSSFLLGLSSKSTEKVYHAVIKNLFTGSVETIFNRYKAGIFSEEKYIEEQYQVEEHYKRRCMN